MGGNYVFPGGMLDEADRELAARGSAFVSRGSSDLVGSSEILPYAVAAIRETFEEAGVLLGGAGGPEEIRGLLEKRRAGPLPAGWLLQEGSTRGWRFGSEALRPWARWITPIGMKRRFDARFFVAEAPSDQSCSPDGSEVVAGLWATPEEALTRNMAGELPLAPPTLVTLHQLLAHPDAESFLAEAGARGWGSPLAPRFVPFDGGGVIVQPWDPQLEDPGLRFDPAALESAVLPVGHPFSRLWFNGRTWRPIRAG
jgi:8-oxo-dGTP pyrophosphatase MutT (NUDIX family)